MNAVFLSGRLVKDPDLHYTQNQNAILDFTLAVDRDYIDDDGNRLADFIRCKAWNNRATYLGKYAIKGAKIGVLGKIQTRKVVDDTGKANYYTEVLCSKVEILEFPKHRNNSGNSSRHNSRQRDMERRETYTPYQSEPGSGYEVYTPPGLDDMDDYGNLR